MVGLCDLGGQQVLGLAAERFPPFSQRTQTLCEGQADPSCPNQFMNEMRTCRLLQPVLGSAPLKHVLGTPLSPCCAHRCQYASTSPVIPPCAPWPCRAVHYSDTDVVYLRKVMPSQINLFKSRADASFLWEEMAEDKGGLAGTSSASLSCATSIVHDRPTMLPISDIVPCAPSSSVLLLGHAYMQWTPSCMSTSSMREWHRCILGST